MSIGPEKRVEDALLFYIDKIGGYAIKNQASATTGKGRPDISACINGKYVAIEVKRGHGNSRTTISQYNHLIRIASANGLAYYVNDSLDFENNLDTLLRKSNRDWVSLTLDKSTPTALLKSLNNKIHENSILKILPNGNVKALKG